MRRMFSLGTSGLAAVVLIVGTMAAHAAGRAGLWTVTQTMNFNGAGAPQIPPEAQARMKAMGVQIPGAGPITTHVCVSAAEAAGKVPERPAGAPQDCKMQNIMMRGQTVHADMVCSGPHMKGHGTFDTTYDSDTHYTGHMAFNGTQDGRPAIFNADMEGTWQSADCGNLGH